MIQTYRFKRIFTFTVFSNYEKLDFQAHHFGFSKNDVVSFLKKFTRNVYGLEIFLQKIKPEWEDFLMASLLICYINYVAYSKIQCIKAIIHRLDNALNKQNDMVCSSV